MYLWVLVACPSSSLSPAPLHSRITESEYHSRKQGDPDMWTFLIPPIALHLLYLLLCEYALGADGLEWVKQNPMAAVFSPFGNHCLFLPNTGHSKQVAFCLNWEHRSCWARGEFLIFFLCIWLRTSGPCVEWSHCRGLGEKKQICQEPEWGLVCWHSLAET